METLTTNAVETPATIRVGLRRKRRKKAPIPLDMILEQPFVRVTVNRVQLTMTRDTLAALGRPTHVRWLHHSVHGLIELRAADTTQAEDQSEAFAITYGKLQQSGRQRPSAVVTIPIAFRPILEPGKYMVVMWSDTNSPVKWVKFGTKNQLIRLKEGGDDSK